MDSAMQLALMAKAKKVFGADDTFLSFPVSPLPYTKRELDFFSDSNAEELRQSQHNLQAFSTLVNLIPDDEAWLPTETLFLWDVYEQVLKEGNFAESTRTPDEEAAYQRALSFLRVTGADGLLEDSPQMKAYRQHKDAFLLVQQKYAADKFTGENASDPLEKQRWREVDEPAQRALLNELQTQWITAGYKNEVEAAQAKVVSLGARSPLQTWAEWNSRFNEDIDTITGSSADASTVFPSFFSPSNAIDDGAWQPFKLSAEEIKVLLNEAPAELRERFNADIATAGNKSLTFEFSSAAIQRPWFASDVFKARFWRFADASRVISDGGKPAKGTCPAYVTAIVFARKVREEVKPAEPVRPTIPPVGIPRPGILGRIGIMRPDLVARPGIVARPSVTPQPTPQVQAQTPATTFTGFQFAAGVRDQNKLKMRMAERSMAARTPANETPAASRTMFSARMAVNPALRRPGIPIRTANPRPTVSPADASRRLSIVRDHRLFQRLERPRIRIPQPTQPTPTPPVTQPPAPPPPPVQDDSIYILAFICKSLPKSPDPDPTLQW